MTPRTKEDILADLERIAALPPNWDGYDGKVFESAFVDRMRKLIEQLSQMHVVFDRLVPVAGGDAVQFEWRKDGRIVELEVTTAWTLCWLRGRIGEDAYSEGMHVEGWDQADCWCVLRGEFPEFAPTTDEKMATLIEESEAKFPGFRKFVMNVKSGRPAVLEVPMPSGAKHSLHTPGVIAAIQESQINLSREGNPDPRIVTEDDGDPD
jgi:hypothetical protein